jgi:hypothetical protein
MKSKGRRKLSTRLECPKSSVNLNDYKKRYGNSDDHIDKDLECEQNPGFAFQFFHIRSTWVHKCSLTVREKVIQNVRIRVEFVKGV